MNDDIIPIRSETISGVYNPFPTFVDWYAGGFEPAAFDRYAELLADAKANASEESLDAAMTAATRYAAIDTGAIEGLYTVDRGFTRTVATQSAAWEAAMESRGGHVRRAFDDALGAYEYVLDAATRAVEISEMWIRQLHEIVCASQETHTVYTSVGPQEQPLARGKYKTMPNSPTLKEGHVHAYAPVADTGPEMYRFVTELRSEAFLSAHPIVQAAYAHYAYVCVHPFADGNGRVARALASIYLYRHPGVPLVVFADQRNDYFDVLELADRGDSLPFIGFMATRTLDAIGIIRSMLQRTSPPLAKSLQGINDLFRSQNDDKEVRAAAVQLRDLALAELKKQVRAAQLPSELDVLVNPLEVKSIELPPGYRGFGKDTAFWMNVKCSWPYKINVLKNMAALVRHDPAMSSELMLASRANDGMEVWLREIVPVVSETLKLKLTAWAEGKLAEVLAEVEAQGAAGRLRLN